jgi:glycosyltransferase involved in cell wall biosynthesis
MQRRGVKIGVFAFIKPKKTVDHPNVRLIKNVNYFRSRQYLKILYFHFYWFLTRPHRYLTAFILALVPRNSLFKLFLTALPYVYEVRSFGPDMLHAHFGTRPADFCMLVKIITGIPFTFTTHGYDVHRAPAGNYRLKSILAQSQITISNFNKHIMINRFKVPESKVKVIRCGIDFKQAMPAPMYEKKNTIITIARLEHIKGIDILMRACKKLEENNVPFQCLIVGDGPERKDLESLAASLSLKDKIIFLGARPHDEVFALMRTAKLMVLPSRSESLSVALMEAMACGVPVIGPDIMGNPELITDGESGFLVKPDDIEGLFTKMRILLTADVLREKFRLSAYDKVVQDFNLSNEVDKLFKFWENSLAAHKNRKRIFASQPPGKTLYALLNGKYL